MKFMIVVSLQISTFDSQLRSKKYSGQQFETCCFTSYWMEERKKLKTETVIKTTNMRACVCVRACQLLCIITVYSEFIHVQKRVQNARKHTICQQQSLKQIKIALNEMSVASGGYCLGRCRSEGSYGQSHRWYSVKSVLRFSHYFLCTFQSKRYYKSSQSPSRCFTLKVNRTFDKTKIMLHAIWIISITTLYESLSFQKLASPLVRINSYMWRSKKSNYENKHESITPQIHVYIRVFISS